MAFDPPRKDAKPSPARQFGPGTSGGRWQHRLPFCIWGPAHFAPPRNPTIPTSRRHRAPVCAGDNQAVIARRVSAAAIQLQHWIASPGLRRGRNDREEGQGKG
jgi:hypothetical protein